MHVAAVLLSVMLAAIINGFVLMVSLGSASVGTFVFSWMFTSIAGVVVSSPGWVFGSLFVLPVVTHRVGRHGSIKPLTYWVVAAVLGALLMVPTVAILGAGGATFTGFLFGSGSIGGLTIAMTYKHLILNSLADERDAQLGAHLG